jgi:hypothetical protein
MEWSDIEAQETYRASLPAIGVYGHTAPWEILANLVISHDSTYGWELQDHYTGEIFPVATQKSAKSLQARCLKLGRLPYEIALVRTTYTGDTI